jgi:hypothetical protein
MLWLTGDYGMCKVASPPPACDSQPFAISGRGKPFQHVPFYLHTWPVHACPPRRANGPSPSGPALQLAQRSSPLLNPRDQLSSSFSIPSDLHSGQQVRQASDSAQHVHSKPNITGRGRML